jgi:hypothetical protein
MMTRLNEDLRRGVVGLAAALWTLAACGGDDKDTATTTETTQVNPSTTTGGPDTGSTTDASTTTTGGTTTTTDPTTDGPTTTGGTTTTTTTTTGETTADATTSETGGSDLDQACQAACEQIYGCFPDEFYTSVEECMDACFAQASGGPACSDAAVVFNECQAMMPCDDLLLGLINDDYGTCQDEFDAFTAACR